jgi:hypothetical protein
MPREISMRGGNLRALMGLAVVLTLAWGAPAGAVIIASGDGTGNTSAPPDNPGWAHVARCSYATSVYIGDGWILTANHVPSGDVTIEGVLYRRVPGSDVTLDPADLKLFQIESDPGLPPLPIAAGPPAGEVIMIGKGRNRGDPIYDFDPSPDLDGWDFAVGSTIRWGTNEVESVSVEYPLGTGIFFFTSDFSGPSGGTDHECQVVSGDSGGPVFAENDGEWELAGIQITQATLPGQENPPQSALFGNESWSAQLSHYRAQILDVVADMACNDGFDQDGDGLIDYPDDPGCDDLLDPFETSETLPCDDGFDNDGDGGIDFDPVTFADPGDENTPPSGEGDPGCRNPSWSTESPECQDGIEDDGDGQMDYDAGYSANGSADPAGPDPECVDRPWRDSEAPTASSCGLGGELTLLLPALVWMWRRRR